MEIQILTRCTRPEHLLKVQESIILANTNANDVKVKWRILFDAIGLDKIDSRLLSRLSNSILDTEFNFWESFPGDYGHTLLNRAIHSVPDHVWVYILDDDNEIHPELLNRCSSIAKTPSMQHVEGIIVSQFVGKKDFTGLDIREAKSENVRVQGIDMAQFILRKSLIGLHRLRPAIYTADGIFIEEIYNSNVEKFHFDQEVLCYYNSLQKGPGKSYMLPRVVLLGCDDVNLKSNFIADFESTDLNIVLADDSNVVSKVIEHDPDSIISVGKSFADFPNLASQPSDVKLRWVNIEDVNSAGEIAYRCGMNYNLTGHEQDMVSIFTPVFNTKSKLLRTYDSVKSQTYTNWEWVIVNDSTDNVTLQIAENIAKSDPRVKVFNFDKKTKGIIGESKYRACAMSRGKYLFELDHDDVILPHALQTMKEAFDKHPDAGFVYSDCAEIDEQHNSLCYGPGFSFGYGSYRTENHNGRDYQIANTANVNPLTIRHIVGVANHFRAWRRDVYFAIGGHNRRLSITDDYELVVRTFLATRMVKVKKGCYLQFYHNSNSQDATRPDIQRRVRTISTFYNESIKRRFEELGVEDWAYTPQGGWNVAPRTGDGENYVNYIVE